MPIDDKNPFDTRAVRGFIDKALTEEGYVNGKDYEVDLVPNIVDISYGRDVGYTFTKHDLGEEIHSISATNIRKQLNEAGNS